MINSPGCLLVRNPTSQIIAARYSRSIDISRVSIRSLVALLLIRLDTLLYSPAPLQRYISVYWNIISPLHVHIHELACPFLPVFRNLAFDMLHTPCARIAPGP